MFRSRSLRLAAAVGVFAAAASAAYLQQDRILALLPSPTEEPAIVAEKPPQPVRVAEVIFQSATSAATYTGEIRPRYESTLGFRVGGKIVQRLVDTGDRVTAGQTLAVLDDADLRLALQTAEASLSAATIDLVRARADLTRNRTLFERGFVSQAGLDQAISGAAEATARKDSAARERDLAANQLSYTTLVADAPGVVTQVMAEVGQVASVGQTLFAVARTDALEAEFALPEQDYNSLDGQLVTAQLWGDEDRDYALQLREISPDVDPASRTYRVRMAFTAPDADVVLGRTVTIAVHETAAAPVVKLPLGAILNDGEGPAVWRVTSDGAGVARVGVEIASLDADFAMIRGDIMDGDQVVSLGAQKIDPARPVRLVEIESVPTN
jgi:RND family efflux transporter MFP subunit